MEQSIPQQNYQQIRTNRSLGTDISESITGAVLVGLGTTSAVLTYEFAEVFKQPTQPQQYSTILHIPRGRYYELDPALQGFSIGAEAKFLLATTFLVFGAYKLKKATQSLYYRFF